MSFDRLDAELVKWIMLRRSKISGVRTGLENSACANEVERREKKASNISPFTHVLFQPSSFVLKNFFTSFLGKYEGGRKKHQRKTGKIGSNLIHLQL